ncbi:MAG: hypothetical protein GC192_03145 [Bacteroidetes bacterium]|nr:hypothetical protein [Bacteroidota bacterium]
MQSIISKYGWPKKSEVGELAAKSCFYVVQHSLGEKARKKYLPKLKRACRKKEADWSDYAAMYDHLALAETGYQRYGTQFHRDGFNGKIELSPLENPEFVEKRRREIGLPPLIPVLEKQGIPLNVPQQD